jgi:hypothetical protein
MVTGSARARNKSRIVGKSETERSIIFGGNIAITLKTPLEMSMSEIA